MPSRHTDTFPESQATFADAYAAANKHVTDKANKKKDALLTRAETGLAKVYAHAVGVTGRDELEARYTKLRADLAAQDAIIAKACDNLALLSAEMEDVIAEVASQVSDEVERSAAVAGGCLSALKEEAANEKGAQGGLGARNSS
ncbi:uncharacterized protein EHS24_002724 [Apiotrichum porosum]|uniref:Uncharacterized protein n=1 Tax=Apiotrichum porosum TaxID=105984 RepID=A0A427XH89_9TREE|nr:uncharacterized protein EHS24_002724 [Apiotrichum porosum]RSH78259.1 hypothetical protein EHS24_002724 [Apiotrichum porosum]